MVMLRPELRDVAIVCIDCVAYNLTRLALQRSAEEVKFNTVAVFTDWPGHFIGGNHLIIPFGVKKFKLIAEVDDFLWYHSIRDLRVSHVLNVQYDGFVLNGDLWRNSWLDYDYIGAPWPWHHDGLNVGNGGFSLRSTRLMRYLATNRDRFPRGFPEDETLCRHYRPALEAEGFRWAPLEIAHDFSFEREAPHPTFGFHGIFNIPHVLTSHEFAEWKQLAPPYVRSKPEWKELP